MCERRQGEITQLQPPLSFIYRNDCYRNASTPEYYFVSNSDHFSILIEVMKHLVRHMDSILKRYLFGSLHVCDDVKCVIVFKFQQN